MGGAALRPHPRPHTRSPCSGTPRRALRCSRLHAAQTEQFASPDLVPQLIEFLKEDLQHLFDDQGIDRSKYEENVVFEDPITRHTSLQGYLFNIGFLRRVFDPTFALLDIRQTGPTEVTTRWSMVMRPTFVLPALQPLWNPVLTFTGTSIMGVNPATGRFNSHKDTWDAIDEQSFFSLQAFAHMLSQVFDLRRTPVGLETPPYTVLLKKAQYEVRRYEAFTVAQLPLRQGLPAAVAGGAAFGALAGYIFGKNAAQERMSMTTPVYSTPDRMQFYLGGGVQPAAAPAPVDPGVEVAEVPGATFAVACFSGLGGEETAAREAARLKKAVEADGLRPVAGAQWVLARYNDPGTPPPFRRNEVLLPLDDFKLW